MERERFEKRPKLDYVFGIRAVMEAIEAGKEFDKIFVKKGLNGDLANEMLAHLRRYQISFQYVPIEKLNRLTQKNHQGVIGLTSPITYQDIEMILPRLYEEGKNPFILVLDGITDIRNFGAIARSAECAGVDAIIIAEKGAATVNADAIKTSAGALHKIPVCRVKNLNSTLKFLQQSGLVLSAASERANSTYYETSWIEPTAIIMGAEDVGVSSENIRLCDNLVQIPMNGTISSLNVSVAAGILLFEVVKQRTLENNK